MIERMTDKIKEIEQNLLELEEIKVDSFEEYTHDKKQRLFARDTWKKSLKEL